MTPAGLMEQAVETAARKHIADETGFAQEVAIERGQMFDNVKHMKWFLEAVEAALMEALASGEQAREDAL